MGDSASYMHVTVCPALHLPCTCLAPLFPMHVYKGCKFPPGNCVVWCIAGLLLYSHVGCCSMISDRSLLLQLTAAGCLQLQGEQLCWCGCGCGCRWRWRWWCEQCCVGTGVLQTWFTNRCADMWRAVLTSASLPCATAAAAGATCPRAAIFPARRLDRCASRQPPPLLLISALPPPTGLFNWMLGPLLPPFYASP